MFSKFNLNILDRLTAQPGVQISVSNPSRNINCTEFEVDKWALSEFILNKLVPIVGVHPYPLDELMLMSATVCRLQPTYIFEWGTHVGKSARIFYETCKHYNINSEIHSFDLPDDIEHIEHPHKKRGVFLKNIKAVKLYQEDGLKKGIGIFQSSTADNKTALFYLDGDHLYDTVVKEIETILNSIPEANILLHDTFYQSGHSGYNIGPYKAIVDSLKGIAHDYYIQQTTMGLPGMTLIYKK